MEPDPSTHDPHRRDGPVSTNSVWRFVPMTLLMPVLAATVGLDGGPIFQIVAVENLRLSPTALGIAFGLGVVSLPFQLAAARIPLRHARHNVQAFLILTAVQAWILAVLVAVDATSGLAEIALGVTVTAELAVSILFATAWQPLLSFTVDPTARQRLNASWQAIARGVLAGSLLVFGALSGPGRPIFLLVVGVAATATSIGLGRIRTPDSAPDQEVVDADARTVVTHAPSRATLVFVVLGLANFGALPLWLVYLGKILWPAGNLGLVAAVQILAAMAAMLAWRPTDQDVSGRVLVAAIVALAGSCSILLVDGPTPTPTGQAVLLAATALIAMGVTTTRIAMLEVAHRMVTTTTAVRIFTLLDVVASTSLQIGLLASGFLIAASTSTSTWLIDPYQILIIAAAASTVIATHRLRTQSQNLTV